MPSTSSFFDDQTQTGATLAWSTPLSRVEASDDSRIRANFALSADTTTRTLHVSNFLTFNVPLSYRLLGIEINIEWRSVTAGDASGTTIILEQNQAAIAGADNKGPSLLPGAETIDTFGSSTDLWNTGFTHIADLAPSGGTISDFGMALQVTDGPSTADVTIDSIECVIHWEPTTPVWRRTPLWYYQTARSKQTRLKRFPHKW